jgi:tryptophan-rich sensory protein
MNILPLKPDLSVSQFPIGFRIIFQTPPLSAFLVWKCNNIRLIVKLAKLIFTLSYVITYLHFSKRFINQTHYNKTSTIIILLLLCCCNLVSLPFCHLVLSVTECWSRKRQTGLHRCQADVSSNENVNECL